MKSAKAEYEKLQDQQARLHQEVVKSLSGASAFDTELLKELLDENKKLLLEAERAMLECQVAKENEEERIRYLAEQYRNISDWASEFDNASNDEKKMILARIIERITVDRNYQLTIIFFVSQEEFERKMGESESNIKIVQASRSIRALAG